MNERMSAVRVGFLWSKSRAGAVHGACARTLYLAHPWARSRCGAVHGAFASSRTLAHPCARSGESGLRPQMKRARSFQRLRMIFGQFRIVVMT